jgi:hypothetical protein
VANIKVLLYDQAGLEYDVSYIQEIPLSLSYLIADVKDPSKRNTTFSKTINFNSKDVDLFFRVIWKLNSTLTTFDPRLKCKIKYYVNEVLQLDGDLQLIKVIVDPDSKTVNYQTTATGTIGNLFLAIGDAYLTDLDFSAYDHSLTKANVTNSWIPATSVTGVIGSGYYYGLINWGENNVLTDVEYHVKHMRPQLYKREYMAKIFAAAGYTWTSTYLDSTYYKSQLIPPTKEYLTLGTTAITNSQFYARRNATQTGTTFAGNYSGSDWYSSSFSSPDVVLFNEDNVAPYNDAGGNYATGTGIFSPTTTNTFIIETLIDFEIVLTNSLGTATNALLNAPSYVTVKITQFNGTNWQTIATASYGLANEVMTTLTSNTYQIYVQLPSWAALATENYRVEIFGYLVYDLFTAASVPVTTGTTTAKINVKTNSTYAARLINNNITEGGTLEINQCIPTEVKQIDWLMTEIKAANLYMVPNPDKAKDYIIEPRDDGFYTGEDNWSELLDFSKDYEVLPVSELDTKRYEFWNKQDSDQYNDAYFKQYKETYGFGFTDCVSEFVKPVKKTELIYAPTPIVDNQVNGLILPKIFKNDNGTIKPMKSVIRQLYRGGNINMSYGGWKLRSSLAGDTVYNYYPFVGEVDNPYTPTLSLNWDTPQKVYYNYINATYTDNNLKNKYYSKMINQLSDKRSAVVKAYFNLNELKVKDFSFRKVVWVDHFSCYFYIQNFEYIMNTQQSTLVTMLKLQDYDTWQSNTIELPNEDPSELNRIVNGNYSNGINNTNNGNASHIVNGRGNFIASGATDIQLDNCTNVVVNGDVSAFRGIGLSNVVITNTSNSTSIIAPNAPITITSDTTLDITYHNRTVFADATAGDITIYWDSATMNHCTVNFIRADGSANIVYLSDADATVEVMGNSVPYDTSLAPFNQYDVLPIIQRLDSGGVKQLYLNY